MRHRLLIVVTFAPDRRFSDIVSQLHTGGAISCAVRMAGMEREPHSTSGSITGAVVLLVGVLLGVYVGGYFALGKKDYQVKYVNREYRYDWLAFGYGPLAHVEAAMMGNVVWVSGPTRCYNSYGEAHPCIPTET